MSGAIVTEYAAHDIASTIASRSPPRSADRSPPEPRATSATPAQPIAVATQNRPLSRSRPTTDDMIAAKIGVIPRISATVVAEPSFSAYTNENWLTSRKADAAAISARLRRPPTLNERSSATVDATASTAAAPYRIAPYASGWKPCVSTYLVTVRLNAQI